MERTQFLTRGGPSGKKEAMATHRLARRIQGNETRFNLGGNKTIRSDFAATSLMGVRHLRVPISFPPRSGSGRCYSFTGRGSEKLTGPGSQWRSSNPKQPSLVLFTRPHRLSTSAPRPSQGEQHPNLSSQDPGVDSEWTADLAGEICPGLDGADVIDASSLCHALLMKAYGPFIYPPSFFLSPPPLGSCCACDPDGDCVY